MKSPFTLAGQPVFSSGLVPEEREVVERTEWIERTWKDGRLHFKFRHELRRHGSVTETKTIPRQAFIIAGMGIVMHPADYAAIRMSVS